jgi:putative membrane-bound dehydrogenase-like protein
MRNTARMPLPGPQGNWVCASLLAAAFVVGAMHRAEGEPAPDHPGPLSPAESLKQFTVADGLEISLVVAEPEVTQPLSISFDDRGRMWVLQYRQYPNPNGLKAVAMDNWLRTKYDRVPEPPPKGPKGQDRISIYQDTDGDGRAERVKDFLSDLNLASGMALGYDGVFVVQPPYLLYYADRDRNDVPDGPPDVLLKGFGMEDAHAFANSLTFGPDGWLYGVQGSTSTAEIRGIGFQQGAWRYHPRTKQFELFAEGGGNSFGLDFDRFGNLFAAGNTVEPLVHHVQGAYYVKGFGKHGPLHNPHAYGYFQPVLHHGYVGDSLTGGAVVYQGGAFPARFENACIAPNTRHNACRFSTIETRGSTFATRAAGDFVTSGDIWFRPVDMTVGPDGAVYIADWYDYNISHSSPTNRSQWYQPSRLDGRVWRVAPKAVKPIRAGSFDLSKKSSAELIKLLSHANDWYARAARRILAERRDASLVPALAKLALESPDQRQALQGLWSEYVSAALDDALALAALDSPHQYVRAWTVRLIGDAKVVSLPLERKFVELAQNDPSVVVRSQLACTAKRLPADPALAIVGKLLAHDEDVDDPHIGLLIWWAIEDKAISDASVVLELIESSDAWRRPLVERIVIERLARRFVDENDDTAFAACAKLLTMAPNDDSVERVVSGMLQALSGRKLDHVPWPLEAPLAQLLSKPGAKSSALELALRVNVADASTAAMTVVADRKRATEDRVALVKALGETRVTAAIDCLASLLGPNEAESLQIAVLSALGYFQDDRIADAVLAAYPRLALSSQARAVELLCSRRAWARRLLAAVDAQEIPTKAVSVDQLKPLADQGDEQIAKLIARHWGRIQSATPLEMQGRITAVQQLLARAAGDAGRGREHFEKVCATCHKLHGNGNAVGPDLTGADRKNRDTLTRNIVDPSAVLREEFLTHVAVTTDGRVVSGLLAESTAETITLLDAKNKRTLINRHDLEELRESAVSLMPEKLLDDLSDGQLRDLFAYLQSDPAGP